MGDGTDQLFSRDEALGGMPARRATALLFLIESRTAHLVDRAKLAMAQFRTEESDQARELAFVEAFALGRQPPLQPTIQDLEHYAPEWADLVPNNPRMRAALAHLVGRKYQFRVTDIPRMQSALGLEEAIVHSAYQRLYGQQLDTIYDHQLPMRARFEWIQASLAQRLESLSPFWTTFWLTLTSTLGPGILALPIALAFVGPLPAILLLTLVGLINVLTITWMAESASRTASIRFGGAYFGRMVREYLGGASALLLTSALVIYLVAGLLAYSVGFSSALSSVTGIVDSVWVVALFAVAGWLIWRGSGNSRVASAIGQACVQLVLLLALVFIGLPHLDPGNLGNLAIPGVGEQPFDLSLLGLAFGVLLVAYFGHTSVGSCAVVVLRRDPSSRSLIRGVIAAQLATIAVYSIWIFSINGALTSEMLTGHAGTVLEPLAAVSGPSVYVVGSIFVVLTMGAEIVGKLRTLRTTIRDWLPRRTNVVVLLPRGRGRLVFEPRGSDSNFVLTYHGLSGDQPRLRMEGQANGRTWRVDHVGAGTWAARDVFNRIPEDILADLELTVEVRTVEEDQVRLRITTPMRLRYQGSWTPPGLDLIGLLDADASEREANPDEALLRWMLRQGNVRLGDAAAWAGHPETRMHAWLQRLVESGGVRSVQKNGETLYRANVARRRARHIPDGLDMDVAKPTSRPGGESVTSTFHAFMRQVGAWIHSEHGRRIVEYGPLVGISLFAVWMVVTDHASFTRLVSISGAVAVPIFTGIFPCLLLISSRRKGDLVPGVVSRVLDHPWLVAGMYALFLSSILLHGLIIWTDTIQRVMALLLAAISLIVTVIAIRTGAFDRRTVFMLRDEQHTDGSAALNIVSGGAPAEADVQFTYAGGAEPAKRRDNDIPAFASLRHISTTLPESNPEKIKVWANRISPQGDLQGLPASIRLVSASGERRFDLGLSGGTALVPRDGSPCTVHIDLDHPSEPPRKKAKRTVRDSADVHALLSAPAGSATPASKGH